MLSKENLNYAVRNLLNRKLRSFLTVLSIFVGIATIFLFVSFGTGLYKYIDDLAEDIGTDKLLVQAEGIGAPGSDDTFTLTDDDLEVFKKTRGIDRAAGMPLGVAEVKNDDKLTYQYLMGISTEDEEYQAVLDYLYVDIVKGRMVEEGDDSKIVLGYSYMIDDRIFQKGLDIGDKISINNIDYKIVGFLDEFGNPQDDANVYLTIAGYKKALSIEGDINYVMLTGDVENPSQIEQIKERAIKNLRKERDVEEGKEDFFITSYDELIESFSSILDIVIGFIILIAFVSIIVSAINTANTMFTSILERTKEIGVLKAIGAKNSEILEIFLMESSILGFVAGVIGVIVGYVLSKLAGTILDSLGWGFLQPYFPLYLFIGCILFATLVGTISGVIPAYNASKKNPVDSLRYE